MRFGNVLGSSGSVVPIFRRQIAAGGPVTVTDERMTRYFMTIPEAVQLIIRSGSLASAAARCSCSTWASRCGSSSSREAMIGLSGLEPERDIAIEIVGARPGEKLHEELFNPYERPQPTPAEKILRAERDAARPGRGSSDVRPRSACSCSRATRPALAAKVAELSAVRAPSAPPRPAPATARP